MSVLFGTSALSMNVLRTPRLLRASGRARPTRFPGRRGPKLSDSSTPSTPPTRPRPIEFIRSSRVRSLVLALLFGQPVLRYNLLRPEMSPERPRASSNRVCLLILVIWGRQEYCPMDGLLADIRRKLTALSSEIVAGRYARASRPWGGADVVVSINPPKPPREDRFYPEPRYVLTQYALELSWLIEALRDIFSPVIDSASKIEFYGRLANAANRYLEKVNDESQTVQDLLFAVAHEAFAIRDEMEEGEFRFLPVAVGNTIWDDFVDEAERSGYLGPEATRQFFEDMEKRHHDD